jgi:hypothetical protein
MATTRGQRHCHQGDHDYRPEHEPDDAALTSRKPRSSQRRPLMAPGGGRCCGVLIAVLHYATESFLRLSLGARVGRQRRHAGR